MRNDIEIKNTGELKEFFRSNRKDENAQIYVSTKIRREWMLGHLRTIINGKVSDINFENKGGGVWLASLSKQTFPETILITEAYHDLDNKKG